MTLRTGKTQRQRLSLKFPTRHLFNDRERRLRGILAGRFLLFGLLGCFLGHARKIAQSLCQRKSHFKLTHYPGEKALDSPP